VVGVDINPQPNYPFEFIQDDALFVLTRWVERRTVRDWLLSDFDAIHASPPCQLFTKARKLQGNAHADLVGPTRELLKATGLPYVIENVVGAPLINPVRLEGAMFGLNTNRPRLFETNWPVEMPVLIPPPLPQAKMGRPPKPGQAIQVVGHFSDVPAGREAMGIPWMNQGELAQAIPPAYTDFIGSQLLEHIPVTLNGYVLFHFAEHGTEVPKPRRP
jgi:DNA (cytosine-5)-methyltransferase 1